MIIGPTDPKASEYLLFPVFYTFRANKLYFVLKPIDVWTLLTERDTDLHNSIV